MAAGPPVANGKVANRPTGGQGHRERRSRVKEAESSPSRQMLGTEVPSKIGTLTLMHPIHGNL